MKFETFSPTQLQTLTWWSDSSPYKDLDAVICDGAVRSGKTMCMGISFVCWAMRRFDGQRFALCGRTIGSLRRNLLSGLLPVLGDIGFSVEERLSKNSMEIGYRGRKNTFYLFGGRDESSQALIQGVTLAGVLMDEAALMPRSFVEQACARCSVPGSKIWFNCNPEGPYHWFYSQWIKKAEEKRTLYLHFSLEDNPALTREVIARYRSMFSGTLGKMDYSKPEESIKKMANYIRQLQEELEYKLANLDKANFNETGLDEITEPISAQIGDVEGAVTQLRLDMNGLSIVVQNGSEASVIQLKSGNITLSSGTITLSGMVTFSDLAGSGTTVINGANIQTGSISADRISGGTLQGVIVKSINNLRRRTWRSAAACAVDKGTVSCDAEKICKSVSIYRNIAVSH